MSDTPTLEKATKRIDELEAKVQQAYHVIAQLLGGPKGRHPDLHSPEGLRALDYFAHEDYDPKFLPYVGPPRDEIKR